MKTKRTKFPIKIEQEQVLSAVIRNPRYGVQLEGAEKIALAVVYERDGAKLLLPEIPPEFLVEIPRRHAVEIAAMLAGSSTSEKKARAARENGKKGGWPKGRPRGERWINKNKASK